MKVAVHNHYEFITRDGFLFKNENSNVGHNLLRPWVQLYQLCQSTGIELYTLDQIDPSELDLVIYMDRPTVEPDIGTAKKVLIIYEPETILPQNWDPSYHDQFSKVLTWNDRLLWGSNYEKHNFTVDWRDRLTCDINEAAFLQRKKICMIQSAKNSKHPNSLYPKRIEAILWFQQNAMFEFSLYGQGWDKHTFFCAKGAVDNKLQTMSAYLFALTFENCDNAVGYISEKILDAFMAGVVPIYWGAPNIDEHIPRSCYIDMTGFGSWEELYQYITNMDYERYRSYLDAIDDFIRSEKAIPFSNDHEVNQLYRLIEDHK